MRLIGWLVCLCIKFVVFNRLKWKLHNNNSNNKLKRYIIMISMKYTLWDMFFFSCTVHRAMCFRHMCVLQRYYSTLNHNTSCFWCLYTNGIGCFLIHLNSVRVLIMNVQSLLCRVWVNSSSYKNSFSKAMDLFEYIITCLLYPTSLPQTTFWGGI